MELQSNFHPIIYLFIINYENQQKLFQICNSFYFWSKFLKSQGFIIVNRYLLLKLKPNFGPPLSFTSTKKLWVQMTNCIFCMKCVHESGRKGVASNEMFIKVVLKWPQSARGGGAQGMTNSIIYSQEICMWSGRKVSRQMKCV